MPYNRGFFRGYSPFFSLVVIPPWLRLVSYYMAPTIPYDSKLSRCISLAKTSWDKSIMIFLNLQIDLTYWLLWIYKRLSNKRMADKQHGFISDCQLHLFSYKKVVRITVWWGLMAGLYASARAKVKWCAQMQGSWILRHLELLVLATHISSSLLKIMVTKIATR